jgi:hypothetical protein
MRIARTFVGFALISVLGISGAYASTVHGYCVSPAASCSDNGSITPTADNPPDFAFSYSGNTKHEPHDGDFWLIGLVPDNRNVGFSLTLDGTNTTASSVTGSLFSSTEWNSGHISNYLTTPSFSTPSHPIDAYLGETRTVDPGADGYYVYTFDFGAFNYKTALGDPEFEVGGGAVPQGMVFFAVLTDSNKSVVIDTPNSASLLETKAPTTTPEPASLMLMGSGVLGVAGMLRRRKLHT